MFADHLPSEQDEQDPSEDPEPEPPTLAIGEEHTFDASPHIALRWRRTAGEKLSTTYLHRGTGDAVLERVDHDDGTVALG